jgi:hypothetical protein
MNRVCYCQAFAIVEKCSSYHPQGMPIQFTVSGGLLQEIG